MITSISKVPLVKTQPGPQQSSTCFSLSPNIMLMGSFLLQWCCVKARVSRETSKMDFGNIRLVRVMKVACGGHQTDYLDWKNCRVWIVDDVSRVRFHPCECQWQSMEIVVSTESIWRGCGSIKVQTAGMLLCLATVMQSDKPLSLWAAVGQDLVTHHGTTTQVHPPVCPHYC